MDELKDGDAADLTKAVLVEKYQREDPTTFAFYGGFESRDELKSRQLVVGAAKLLFNDFFPVRVLIADGASKEQALEFLRLVIKDIERNGVHQAPLDFSEPLETWRDAPPRCNICSAVDADHSARWEGELYLCRECYQKTNEIGS
ncbi:MAG TPA: hypothetical protein VIM99_02675 [Blastocatellia bacterium]